jgi:hypothetical protein
MALTLEAANLVAQKAKLTNPRAAKLQLGIKNLLSYISQHKGNPTLQHVNFTQLTSGSTVIADVACKLYAVCVTRPSSSTQSAYLKLTDDESTAQHAGDQDFTFKVPSGVTVSDLYTWPDGFALSAGLTISADTSASTSSIESTTVSRVSGWCIVGGA